MTIHIHAPGALPLKPEEGQTKTQKTEKPKDHIFAGDLNLRQEPIDQKRGIARQKALKIVQDAWNTDKEIEREILSRREHYAEMKAQSDEAKEELNYVLKDEKAYQELYGVEGDSQEQKDLELLKKRQEYQAGLGAPPTEEERGRLSALDENPLTEYQEKMLKLNQFSIDTRKKLQEAERGMRDDVKDVKQILLEKLEFHPMVDAQKTADDIMEAASKEIYGMLVQEAVSHVDEKQEEAEELAKEKNDKEEKQEERKEELELKRAVQEAMIEQTKEAADRARAKLRQREMPEMDFDEIVELALQKSSFDESQHSLEDMKNKMNLLEADLKGIQVDEEV